jgi:hypothetical protein
VSGDDHNDDVARALAILRDAGFPVERIRILPATGEGEAAAERPPIDRSALLNACAAILDDGEPRAAKELARLLRDRFPGVTRKDVNSILATDGKDRVAYDRATYTYRRWQPGDSERGRED